MTPRLASDAVRTPLLALSGAAGLLLGNQAAAMAMPPLPHRKCLELMPSSPTPPGETRHNEPRPHIPGRRLGSDADNNQGAAAHIRPWRHLGDRGSAECCARAIASICSRLRRNLDDRRRTLMALALQPEF